MKRIGSILLSAVLVMSSFGLFGCTTPQTADPVELEPTISSPTIATDGVLVVGVDYDYAPFGGEVDGEAAGIDVDVASAIAEQLGLTVEFVNVASADSGAAITDGTVDIIMNVEPDELSADTVTTVGTYIYDCPGLFRVSVSDDSTAEPPSELTSVTVGSQEDSLSAWQIANSYSDAIVTSYSSLTETFDALSSGDVSFVAADSIVGAYIAQSYDDVIYAGQLTDSTAIGIGVAATNTDLQTAIEQAVEAIKDNGELDLIMTKWLGDFPDISGVDTSGTDVSTETSTEAATETSASADTSSTE